jgi:lysine/ornithine N-monooxygenase
MLQWTVLDRLMYSEYLQWRAELNSLQQCRFNINQERIKELENNIKDYLQRCGESTLRNIVLWSLGMED